MCGGNLSGLIPINPSLEFYFSQEKYIQCGLFSERCGKSSSKNLICVFFHLFYQKDFGLLFMKIKTFIMYQNLSVLVNSYFDKKILLFCPPALLKNLTIFPPAIIALYFDHCLTNFKYTVRFCILIIAYIRSNYI